MMLVCFLLASLVVFYYSLALPFFSDDFAILFRLSKGDFNAGIFFRPLGDISLYLDFQFFGFNPVGFHLHNVIIHGITSFLVFCLALELFQELKVKAEIHMTTAILAGIFFMVYPFHVEPVVWIVGRGILLSVLWCLFSLWLFCKYERNRVGYIASIICFFVSLGGYETASVIPLLIFSIAYYRGRGFKGSIILSAGYLIGALFFLGIKFLFLGDVIGIGSYFRTEGSFFVYGYNFIALLARSFIPPIENEKIFLAIAIFVTLSGILIAIIVWKRQTILFRNTFYLVLLFCIALLPLITVGIDTHDYEGGRFLYFSSVFLSIYFAYFIFNFQLIRRFKTAVTFLLLFYFSCFFYQVRKTWQGAGECVVAVINNYQNFSEKNIFFLGVPDSKKGAYIFRNGLRESMIIKGAVDASKRIQVLSYGNVGHVGDTYKQSAEKIMAGWIYNSRELTLENAALKIKISQVDTSFAVYSFVENKAVKIFPTRK